MSNTHTHQNTNAPSRANATQDFFTGNDPAQLATLQPPAPFSAHSVVQKKDPSEEGNTLTVEEAKKIIIDATDGLGTNESAVYDAIRRCASHQALKYDATVINAINGDMEGHELWKCYLLIEYGNESNYHSGIRQLWNATAGAGTDEAAVFVALENMDARAKNSFGLKYILNWELSGDDLQRALDLIVTSDTISGNIYGSAEEGEEDLVISEDNLRELIDSQFAGGATQGLKDAMMILYAKPGGTVLAETVARVESIRGLGKGSGLAQYNTAMQKQLEGIEYYKKHKEDAGQVYDHAVDNPSPALDTGKHESFTGSNAQLRFGKIIGDVFGIDAVFGSLISPTGGMAGPGNERIDVPVVGGPKDGGAVATHGSVHDAAGYLYNCHGIGPGYDYLQSEPGSDASNPLAGQTNINWWIEEFNSTGNDVQFIERFLNDNAHIGAAFSKHYDQLNTAQKKDALKVMSETSSFKLNKAGISNTDRVSKINELMSTCDDAEKTELADYFYNHNGFSTVNGVFTIMRPHVSQEAYDDYLMRQRIENMSRAMRTY